MVSPGCRYIGINGRFYPRKIGGRHSPGMSRCHGMMAMRKEGCFMTKVKINPGICGLCTSVEAVSEDGMEVVVKVGSACKSVEQMMAELGDTFDAFEICLAKPGQNALYDYAAAHFPGHASCPVISGIIKCIEVECKLALPQNVSIEFCE